MLYGRSTEATTHLNNKGEIIIEGIKDSTPIWLSFFFMFMSIGALSAQASINFIDAILMTVFIFAAPVQSILIYMVGKVHNISYLYVVLTSTVINFRFLLNSTAIAPYFSKNKTIHVILAMIMLSASSFTVAFVEFKNGKIRKYHLGYFLGVAIPSYIVAIVSTGLGYVLSYKFQNPKIHLIFTIVLPLHFAALTARRIPNYKAVAATLIGVLAMPFLLAVKINFIDVGFALIIGMLLALINRKRV